MIPGVLRSLLTGSVVAGSLWSLVSCFIDLWWSDVLGWLVAHWYLVLVVLIGIVLIAYWLIGY
jgi:hypothetical protein